MSSYPYVKVRLACRFCRRKGGYRLARLAEKFGAEISMQDILRRLAGDCAFWADHWARSPKAKACGAYFPDLEWPRPPPDLPPGEMRLQVVAGTDFKRRA